MKTKLKLILDKIGMHYFILNKQTLWYKVFSFSTFCQMRHQNLFLLIVIEKWINITLLHLCWFDHHNQTNVNNQYEFSLFKRPFWLKVCVVTCWKKWHISSVFFIRNASNSPNHSPFSSEGKAVCNCCELIWELGHCSLLRLYWPKYCVQTSHHSALHHHPMYS